MENVSVSAAPLTRDAGAVNGMVRVYLSSLGNPSTLNLTVKGNYSVNGEFLPSGTQLTVQFSASSGSLTLAYNGQKHNMGKSFALRRHSASGTNGILISQSRESQNPYPGDLSFQVTGNAGNYTLYTIAHVYIENYLYGVVPYEMGNSSNIEALKAQAVAARTYTVRMMQNRASGLYDVKDTTSDQVYRGTPSGNANCVAAVDATKGIVLKYGSSYITTYYSASNGGQTETSRSGTTYAYMKVKDDPFDYANPSSTVKKKTVYADLTRSGNPAELLSLLKTKAISKLNQLGYAANAGNTTLKTLKSVTPHTPKYASPSRLYTKMDFTFTVSTQNAAGQTVSVTQTVTCDIFSELESMLSMGIQSSANELWSVEKSGGNFVLQARRYGHGMGMSQRGAMYMGKLGYTYDQILGFYYDGCKRVQHSFTNTILSADSSEEETTVETPAELEEEDENACTGTVRLANASASLAIRSGKSYDSAIIGSAGNGAIVKVLSSDGSWSMIRFGEICGYVPVASLLISGTPAQNEDPVSEILGFVTVTANDFVNLRSEASMNSTVLGTAPTGAVLTVFSKSGSWARVQYNTLSAYVNTGYVSSVSASYPSGSQLSSGSAAAIVSAEEGAAELRQSPSTSAQIIAQLASDTVVTVLSDDGSWCEVSYRGRTGYIVSEHLVYTDETPPQTGDEESPPETDEDAPDTEGDEAVLTAVVTTEYGSLNMRAEARAGSRILTTIPRGERIPVLSRGESWSAVSYDGFYGHVMTSFLTFDSFTEDPSQETEDITATVVTPGGSLNLRSEPRSGSQILTRVQPYEQVTVHHRGTEWCQVTYMGTTGYVMTAFLSFDEVEAPEDTPEEEPERPEEEETEPEPDEIPEDAQYAIVETVSGSLNLRAAALPGSRVLARIPKGTVIAVEERLAAWSKTTFAGQTGYVSNAYLHFMTDKPVIETGENAVVVTPSGSLNLRQQPSRYAGVIAQIPQHASVQVQQRGDEWCYVAYQGQLGYVMTVYLSFDTEAEQLPQQPEEETPEQPPATSQTAYVHTASGSLNLRHGPSSQNRILTTIPRGEAVEVLAYGDEWCAVSYSGYEGYVMTSFLRFESAENTVPPEEEQQPDAEENTPVSSAGVPAWVDTASGSLNMREAPTKNAKVVTAVPRRAQLTVHDAGNDWCYVSYQGEFGYVMTAYLSFDSLSDRESEEGADVPSEAPENTIVSSGEMQLDVTLEVPDSAMHVRNATNSSIQLWPMCAETGSPSGTLPSGGEAEVILRGQTWCLVAYEDVQGYCYTHLLSVIE